MAHRIVITVDPKGGVELGCPPDRGDYFIAIPHGCVFFPPYSQPCYHPWLDRHSSSDLYTAGVHTISPSPPSSVFSRYRQFAGLPPMLDTVGSLGMNATFSDDRLTILESALLRWTTTRPDICWCGSVRRHNDDILFTKRPNMGYQQPIIVPRKLGLENPLDLCCSRSAETEKSARGGADWQEFDQSVHVSCEMLAAWKRDSLRTFSLLIVISSYLL